MDNNWTKNDLMSEEKRNKLKELFKNTTPAPWYGPRISDVWPPGWIAIFQAYQDEPEECVPGSWFVHTGHMITGDEDERPIKNPDTDRHLADAAFITAARTALPAAIEAIEFLLKELENR